MEPKKPILSEDAIRLFKQQAENPVSNYNFSYIKGEDIDRLLHEAELDQDSPWNQNHPLAKLNRFLAYEICTLQAIQKALTQNLDIQRKDRNDITKRKTDLTKFRTSEAEKFQKQIEGMTIEQIMADKKLAKKLETINLEGLG